MRLLFILSLFLFYSCQTEQDAGLAIFSSNIYTLDQENNKVDAVYIKDGIISALGTKDEVKAQTTEKTQIIDLGDAFVIPGLIEGHGHFSGMGNWLQNLNFLQSKSWQEIVEQVKEKVDSSEDGEWIYGRGWHQDKWNKAPNHSHGTYPSHEDLSGISENNPVILIHASGHSLFANAKAMEISGITKETPDVGGGHIVRDENGDAIGVFEERAMGAIRKAYADYLTQRSPEEIDADWDKSMALAMNECLTNGITSFQDAGAKFHELDRYKAMAEAGEFKMRLWTMIRHSSEEMEGNISKHKVIDAGNGFYTCNAIKSELDGALGSYGAWLLEPYNDKANFTERIEKLFIFFTIPFEQKKIGDGVLSMPSMWILQTLIAFW